MKSIRLKVWSHVFESVAGGRQRHLVVQLPEPAGVDDVLDLDEYLPEVHALSDHRMQARVTHVDSLSHLGLAESVQVLSVKLLLHTTIEPPFAPPDPRPYSAEITA